MKSFSDTPPDFIISIPRDMAEYGVDLLGEDSNYGSDIMAWISEKYERVWEENDRQQNHRFAISILRRKVTGTD